MAKDTIVGVDLGTTNSAISVLQGGDPEIIPNGDGDRTTPSVVAITDDDERLVGRQAKNQLVQNPENTVQSIKRHMGEDYTVRLQGEEYTPEEISAMILREMKESAEHHLGEKPERAVITVPAYFNDKQRQATKDAGEIAGFTVERIVNEPTAAAMAYGLGRGEDADDETVLVYDLGGGTFDVSVLHISDDIYDVIATNGDNNPGGDDWTDELTEHVLDNFDTEYDIDLREDTQAHQRVRSACEEAKKDLSSREKTTINLPFITATDDGPIHLEQEVTREEFEELTEYLVDRTVEPTQDALDEAGHDLDDMDEILLVGGATRMPMVRRQVSNSRQSINPDEVVSLGAAIQAGIITGEVDNTILLDVTPLSLGIEVKGGLFKSIIQRNATIPVEESSVFTTAKDNQTSVDVRIFQGEREIAGENELLGEFTLSGIPPAPAGSPEIKVDFSMDENGIMQISATDKGSGKSEDITIEGGVGLTDEEIEAMKRDAEKHASEDEERRKYIKAINEADRLVKDAQEFIDEHRSDVKPDKIATLRNDIDATKEVLDDKSATLQEVVATSTELSNSLQDAGKDIHTR